jgi:hypothetical protein
MSVGTRLMGEDGATPRSQPQELACSYLHDSVAMSRPLETVSLRTSAFRAHDWIESLPEFRRVSGNGLRTAEWMPADSAERGLRLRREAHPPSLSPRQLRCRSRVGRHLLPTPMPPSRCLRTLILRHCPSSSRSWSGSDPGQAEKKSPSSVTVSSSP